MSNHRRLSSIVILAAISLAACGGSQSATNTIAPPPKEVARYPFNVTELPSYSAKVLITSGGKITEHFIARSGDRTRTDLQVGTINHTSRIVGDSEVVVSYAGKTFYEVPKGSGSRANLGDTETSLRSLFANAEPSEFESIGKENGLAKFRIDKAVGEAGEIFVFVDDASGAVMRQEVWAGEGEARALVYSTELRDFTTDVREDLFAVPPGFRKVNAPLR